MTKAPDKNLDMAAPTDTTTAATATTSPEKLASDEGFSPDPLYDTVRYLKYLQSYLTKHTPAGPHFAALSSLISATPTSGADCVFDLKEIQETIERAAGFGEYEYEDELAPYQLLHVRAGLAALRRKWGDGVRVRMDAEEFARWREWGRGGGRVKWA